MGVPARLSWLSYKGGGRPALAQHERLALQWPLGDRTALRFATKGSALLSTMASGP
jgi:hypothetical protein